MFNIAGTNGLLVHGNSSTSGQAHGSSGQILDIADIMQILINQTNELENLKKQAENDRSTIRLLQNRPGLFTGNRTERQNERIEDSLLSGIFYLSVEHESFNSKYGGKRRELQKPDAPV